MIFPSLEDAILAINKDAKFIVRDDDVKKIEWLDGTSSISQSEITNKLNALNTEFELQFLRNERNILLKETDWMSLPDAPTMSDAWKKYRQDLRDITTTVTDDTVRYAMGDDITHAGWPTKPS